MHPDGRIVFESDRIAIAALTARGYTILPAGQPARKGRGSTSAGTSPDTITDPTTKD